MFNKFLPKKNKFFDLLTELAVHMLDTATLMKEMFDKNDNFSEYSSKIHILENKCDDLTHQVIHELNESFITPIDREDIFSLVNSLDDIVDYIDRVALRTNIYKLKTPLAFSVDLSDILLQQANKIVELIKNLHNYKDATEKIVSVKNLETEGDMVFREALINLFENEEDIKDLIKKKEILETIEKAVDRCQNAATVIEGILIKNV